MKNTNHSTNTCQIELDDDNIDSTRQIGTSTATATLPRFTVGDSITAKDSIIKHPFVIIKRTAKTVTLKMHGDVWTVRIFTHRDGETAFPFGVHNPTHIKPTAK